MFQPVLLLLKTYPVVTATLLVLAGTELVFALDLFTAETLPLDLHLRVFGAATGMVITAGAASLLRADRLFTGLAVGAGGLLSLLLAQPLASLAIILVLAGPELSDRTQRPRLRWLAERGLYAVGVTLVMAATGMLGLTLVLMVLGALTGWDVGPVLNAVLGVLLTCLVAPVAGLAALPQRPETLPEPGSEPLADYLRTASALVLAPFTLVATLFVGLHGLLLLFNGGTPRAVTVPVVIGLVVLWATTWLTLPRGRLLPLPARILTPAFWWLMIVPALLALLVLARQSGL